MNAEGRLSTLHVDVEPGWRGGQRQVLLLCRGLAARGQPVVLAARRGGELAERARAAGIPVEELAVRGPWDVAAAGRLARLVMRVRPAVVGLHSSHSHGLGVLARALLPQPRPLFVVTRRVDFPVSRGLSGWWKYRRGVDGFIAISRAAAAELEGAGIPAGRIRLVHSGVEPLEVPPGARGGLLAELGLAADRRLVGNVGGLSREKDQATLLRAFRTAVEEDPRLMLLLVGDGGLREELERLAAELGLGTDRVRFLGFRNDVERILGALDLFVMSSVREGLGTSVVDAMTAGVPVVVTRAGGLPELVEDGVTGRLVPPARPRLLAGAILEAFRRPEETNRMAEAARETALSRFSAEAMVEGTLAAYRDFLASMRRTS